MDECDIWKKPPARRAIPAAPGFHAESAYWMFGEWDLSARVGSFELAAVQKFFNVVPDNDRQCIRAEIGGVKPFVPKK